MTRWFCGSRNRCSPVPAHCPLAADGCSSPLDGFRCLVCTHDRFRARSRRRWAMTTLLPELAETLPPNLQLDGELVALDRDGRPDFHRLSARMLHGDRSIAITYFVFDVLAVEGLPVSSQPYADRRALLEELDVEGPHVRFVAT